MGSVTSKEIQGNEMVIPTSVQQNTFASEIARINEINEFLQIRDIPLFLDIDGFLRLTRRLK